MIYFLFCIVLSRIGTNTFFQSQNSLTFLLKTYFSIIFVILSFNLCCVIKSKIQNSDARMLVFLFSSYIAVPHKLIAGTWVAKGITQEMQIMKEVLSMCITTTPWVYLRRQVASMSYLNEYDSCGELMQISQVKKEQFQ